MFQAARHDHIIWRSRLWSLRAWSVPVLYERCLSCVTRAVKLQRCLWCTGPHTTLQSVSSPGPYSNLPRGYLTENRNITNVSRLHPKSYPIRKRRLRYLDSRSQINLWRLVQNVVGSQDPTRRKRFSWCCAFRSITPGVNDLSRIQRSPTEPTYGGK